MRIFSTMALVALTVILAVPALRMAKLWDAVKSSSAQGGKPVECRSKE